MGFAEGFKRFATAIFDCDDIALVTTLQGISSGSIKGVPIKVDRYISYVAVSLAAWLERGTSGNCIFFL